MPQHLHNINNESSYVNITDRAIFNELFDRYQPGLLGLAFRILDSREDAEEVVTETFVRLWQSGGKFENAAAVGGWLRVTARNQSLNLLKQRLVNQDKLNQFATLMEDIENTWYHEELMGELLQEVYTALKSLPDKSGKVFYLRYVKGLKNEEIAKLLGIRNQSVRNHLSIALRHLRLAFSNRPDLLSLLIILHTGAHFF